MIYVSDGDGTGDTPGGDGAVGNLPNLPNLPNSDPVGSTNDPAPKGSAGDNAPYWPDDWRETYAQNLADDASKEKVLNRLKRFTSPDAVLKSYFELEKSRSNGTTLPANATPEQLSAWRNMMGIPTEAVGYADAIKELNVPDDDKDLITGFLESSLGANLTPTQVKDTLTWFYSARHDAIDKLETEVFNKDSSERTAMENKLKQDWGGSFQRNLSAIDGLLSQAPVGFKDALSAARMPDGSRLGNNPEILNWLAQLAFDVNPASAVVPGAGVNSASQIDSEIASIEARMRGDTATRNAYYKDETAQARYRELITARDAIARR